MTPAQLGRQRHLRRGAVHRPTSVEQLQELVAGSRRIRALGSGHSFSRVADTDGDLVTLGGLPGGSRWTPTGGRYGQRRRCATARWPAAARRRARAAQPRVAAAHLGGRRGRHRHARLRRRHRQPGHRGRRPGPGDRDRRRCVRLDRGDTEFAGSVVALGALGVVTGVTLDVEPTFDVAQQCTSGLAVRPVRDGLDEVARRRAYSVSVFTDCGPRPARCGSSDAPTEPPPRRDWLGGRRRRPPRHPVPAMDRATCTEQLGRARPVARAAAALPARPHAEQRRRAAVRVPRAARRARSTRWPPIDASRDRVAPVLHGVRAAYGRRRRAVAQPGLRARQPRRALHLGRRHRGRAAGGGRRSRGRSRRSRRGRTGARCSRPTPTRWPRSTRGTTTPAHCGRDLDPDDVFGNAFVDTYLPR